MAEIAGSGLENLQSLSLKTEERDSEFEPEKKRLKVELPLSQSKSKLEDRLTGILCCAVCLDLPKTCFQCINGHLMCAACFNHLLADARLKNETATCPNCRCEINKTQCCRNLAVEKAISELPAKCQYCQNFHPRNTLDWHERELCQERPSRCRYQRIGCPWEGPLHELMDHESACSHPQKPGSEIMMALQPRDDEKQGQIKLFQSLFGLLSYEKISFNDVQLKPYRTDDFITKLFYESGRFSAFNQQWVVKAQVNSTSRDPAQACERSLTFQLQLKNRVSSPMRLYYVALKGPFGEMKVNPSIYDFEFSNDNTETEYKQLPFVDPVECNKVLAAKTINFRFILFQAQQ